MHMPKEIEHCSTDCEVRVNSWNKAFSRQLIFFQTLQEYSHFTLGYLA